jgi:DNA-binding IscR family transcriptional regulator
MIFGASATHALRALAHLAANAGEEAMLGRDLAAEVRAGVLTASRGVRGGYRLARRAEQIALIEIVEPFEGRRVRPGCLLLPDRPCRERGPCSAHAAWSEVKKTSLSFLERTTLADIQGGAVRAGEKKRPRRNPHTRRSAE